MKEYHIAVQNKNTDQFEIVSTPYGEDQIEEQVKDYMEGFGIDRVRLFREVEVLAAMQVVVEIPGLIQKPPVGASPAGVAVTGSGEISEMLETEEEVEPVAKKPINCEGEEIDISKYISLADAAKEIGITPPELWKMRFQIGIDTIIVVDGVTLFPKSKWDRVKEFYSAPKPSNEEDKAECRPFKCDLCGKEYRRSQELGIHKSRMHGIRGPRSSGKPKD